MAKSGAAFPVAVCRNSYEHPHDSFHQIITQEKKRLILCHVV
jgi:hypothetical protein